MSAMRVSDVSGEWDKCAVRVSGSATGTGTGTVARAVVLEKRA